jgi:hypothetical protein
MKDYIVDGTVLFIREATGKELECLRIPSFRKNTDFTSRVSYHTDIAFTLPDPIPVSVAEYRMRPATQEEYDEWRNLTPVDRTQSTTVWMRSWGGGFTENKKAIRIQGMTVEWYFSWEDYPDELTPDVKKTDLNPRQ